MKLDKIDRSILSSLQENARIPNTELAEKVGLSQSACSRRVSQLEDAGVIEGYHTSISNKELGQTITAVIQITLSSQSEKTLSNFEKAASECPFVVACFLMSGESDYLMRVNAKDMEHFEQIHKNWLSTLPGAVRIQSSFALRTVVNRANIDLANVEKT